MIVDSTNIPLSMLPKQKNYANKGYNHPTLKQNILLIIDLMYLSIFFNSNTPFINDELNYVLKIQDTRNDEKNCTIEIGWRISVSLDNPK